jgi:uncharacterized membrane protein YphA (DoxX/SURF4 family)
MLGLGRILIGLCFFGIGVWWFETWEVRAAYLAHAGAPGFLVVPLALTYIVCGGLIAWARTARVGVFPLLAVAGLLTLLLHTDLAPGGIGEYPLERHPVHNVGALIVQLNLMGCLLVVLAAPSPSDWIDVRPLILGRVLLGATLVAKAWWGAWDYDALLDAWREAPLPENLLAPTLAAEILGGLLLAAGRSVRPAAGILLGSMALSTVALHTDFTGAGPYPPATQAFHLLTNGTLTGGLAMLLALGPIAAPPPGSTD